MHMNRYFIMSCTSPIKCDCGRVFDLYSGYCVQINPYCQDILRSNEEFLKIKERYFDGLKYHHFVICAPCIERILATDDLFQYLQIKSGKITVANACYIARKSGYDMEPFVKWVKENQLKDFRLPFKDYNALVSALKNNLIK